MMMSKRLTMAGVAALILGVLLLLAGQSFVPGGLNSVKAQQPTPPATSIPPTQCVPGQACPTPAPTQTPHGRLKTHTPVATSTEKPKTGTPVPPTAAPTNTPQPSSGNEGVNVKPPNTGSGSGKTSDLRSWLAGLGALLIALGGGAAVVGVRQRR